MACPTTLMRQDTCGRDGNGDLTVPVTILTPIDSDGAIVGPALFYSAGAPYVGDTSDLGTCCCEGSGATGDVCAIVAANCNATLTDNGDGTFTHLSNAGVATVIRSPIMEWFREGQTFPATANASITVIDSVGIEHTLNPGDPINFGMAGFVMVDETTNEPFYHGSYIGPNNGALFTANNGVAVQPGDQFIWLDGMTWGCCEGTQEMFAAGDTAPVTMAPSATVQLDDGTTAVVAPGGVVPANIVGTLYVDELTNVPVCVGEPNVYIRNPNTPNVAITTALWNPVDGPVVYGAGALSAIVTCDVFNPTKQPAVGLINARMESEISGPIGVFPYAAKIRYFVDSGGGVLVVAGTDQYVALAGQDNHPFPNETTKGIYRRFQTFKTPTIPPGGTVTIRVQADIQLEPDMAAASQLGDATALNKSQALIRAVTIANAINLTTWDAVV